MCAKEKRAAESVLLFFVKRHTPIRLNLGHIGSRIVVSRRVTTCFDTLVRFRRCARYSYYGTFRVLQNRSFPLFFAASRSSRARVAAEYPALFGFRSVAFSGLRVLWFFGFSSEKRFGRASSAIRRTFGCVSSPSAR